MKVSPGFEEDETGWISGRNVARDGLLGGAFPQVRSIYIAIGFYRYRYIRYAVTQRIREFL